MMRRQEGNTIVQIVLALLLVSSAYGRPLAEDNSGDPRQAKLQNDSAVNDFHDLSDKSIKKEIEAIYGPNGTKDFEEARDKFNERVKEENDEFLKNKTAVAAAQQAFENAVEEVKNDVSVRTGAPSANVQPSPPPNTPEQVPESTTTTGNESTTSVDQTAPVDDSTSGSSTSGGDSTSGDENSTPKVGSITDMTNDQTSTTSVDDMTSSSNGEGTTEDLGVTLNNSTEDDGMSGNGTSTASQDESSSSTSEESTTMDEQMDVSRSSSDREMNIENATTSEPNSANDGSSSPKPDWSTTDRGEFGHTVTAETEADDLEETTTTMEEVTSDGLSSTPEEGTTMTVSSSDDDMSSEKTTSPDPTTANDDSSQTTEDGEEIADMTNGNVNAHMQNGGDVGGTSEQGNGVFGTDEEKDGEAESRIKKRLALRPPLLNENSYGRDSRSVHRKGSKIAADNETTTKDGNFVVDADDDKKTPTTPRDGNFVVDAEDDKKIVAPGDGNFVVGDDDDFIPKEAPAQGEISKEGNYVFDADDDKKQPIAEVPPHNRERIRIMRADNYERNSYGRDLRSVHRKGSKIAADSETTTKDGNFVVDVDDDDKKTSTTPRDGNFVVDEDDDKKTVAPRDGNFVVDDDDFILKEAPSQDKISKEGNFVIDSDDDKNQPIAGDDVPPHNRERVRIMRADNYERNVMLRNNRVPARHIYQKGAKFGAESENKSDDDDVNFVVEETEMAEKRVPLEEKFAWESNDDERVDNRERVVRVERNDNYANPYSGEIAGFLKRRA